MSKEFDNEFYNSLKEKTIIDSKENMSELEEKQSILERLIAEEEEKVIKDPVSLEKWNKQLKAVKEKISAEKSKKAVESGEFIGENATEKDVDENIKEKEEQKEDKNHNNENKEKQTQKDELKQLYHDSIIAYYKKRLATVERQINENQLIPEKMDYEEEVRLELEMYKARDAYLALGEVDPYEQFREEHAFVDRQSHEIVNVPLREKARKYREAEDETQKLDKAIAEYDEDLLKTDISELQRKEYNDKKDELIAKKKIVEIDKAKYKDASDAFEELTERENRDSEVQQKRRDAATFKTQMGYDYQRQKQNIAKNNAEVAEKREYLNIKNRIETREERRDELKKKLSEPSKMDLRTRLELLKELNEEINMLEADKAQRGFIEKGEVRTESQMQQDTNKAYKEIEEKNEDLEKATRKIEKVIDSEDKEIAIENVVSPLQEERNEERVKKQAMVAAAVVENPGPNPDTALDNYMQYKTAECVIKGLEKQVNDPNTLEGAEAILRNAEEIEAQKQLSELQEEIESK